MTRDEAIALRTQQLQGAAVHAEQLRLAIQTITATNKPVPAHAGAHLKKGTRPRKPSPPAIEPWALLKPGQPLPVNPEKYVWPRGGAEKC